MLAAAAAVALIWIVIRAVRGNMIAPGLLSQATEQIPNHPLGQVVSEEVPIHYQLIGSIQSRVPMEAASRVAARITEVLVHAGQRVKRGQVLVVLDSSELKAQVAQALGETAGAQAELARTTADEKRFSALFARGSVTAQERDAAEAAYRGATAKLAQARAAVEGARAGLAYTTVRSPVDGVTVERLAEPGDMAMPGKPLVRLYDENALRVELQVPEELARSVHTATPLDVRIDATRATYQTQVSEIVPAADPASRSFLVRAPIPSGGGLQPGMFARATLAAGNEVVITVPRGAVERVGQLDTVRVYSDGRVQTRMVSLGRGFGNRLEVLAGVHSGERVILDSAPGGGR
jgi:RND family efflux transporter MFP subunit